MSELAIYALLSLLALSNVFWAWTTSRLMDRLMSRDYGEFVKVEKYKNLKPAAKEPKAQDLDDDYAANQAERANKVLSF